jgi:hypothetical protein
VLPLKNWTEPVAVDGETAAVSVTAWPQVEDDGLAASAVAVADLFTVCWKALEELAL